MGLAPRRTAAALLAAVSFVLGSMAPALAGQAGAVQAKEGRVTATGGLKFDPPTITVAVGGKVTWTNGSATYHTVTGGDTAPDPASPINGVLDAQQGKTYSVTFTKAGTYQYFCQPHLSVGMKGTVVVGTAATASPSATASLAPTGASVPPASASASASVGDVAPGAGAPTAEATEQVPGVAGNRTLEAIDTQRATYHGAVSGFRFFTMVAVAFLVILAAAVLVSTRPRRSGR
jgi:plastocyanin